VANILHAPTGFLYGERFPERSLYDPAYWYQRYGWREREPRILYAPQAFMAPAPGPFTAPLGGTIYGDVSAAWGEVEVALNWGELTYELELSVNNGLTYPYRLASGLVFGDWSGDLSVQAMGGLSRLRVRSRVGDYVSAWVESATFILHPEFPRWDLTIFGDDGVPILGSVDELGNVVESSFSTHPAHPRPWLDWPKDAAGSEVDFLKGKAKIGQFNITVADKRAVAAQQHTGQVTALLGPHQGLNGLRNRLTFTPVDTLAVVAIDGPLGNPKLHSSYAGYQWVIRDENVRARKIRAFDRTGTTCIFPRGPVNDYGLLPSGKYAVPAATPVRATFEGTADFGILWIDGERLRRTLRLLNDKMLEAARFVWKERANSYVLEHAVIQWRLAAGPGPWNDIVEMPPYDAEARIVHGAMWTIRYRGRQNELFEIDQRDVRYHDTSGKERTIKDAPVIRGIRLKAGGGPLPANNDVVDFRIVYTGPATPDYPLHYDGTAGDFLALALDGEWCTEPLDMRYDAATVDAFVQHCSARITQPTEDLLSFLEKNFYQPLAAAPTLDSQGRISPTRYLLPDENTDLLTLDDANCKAVPEWEHPDTNALNEVEFTYFRDILVDPLDDPLGQGTSGDLIYAKPVKVVSKEDPADAVSHARLGSKKHEIKTELFRAVGRQDGTAASGEATNETGHLLAVERGNQALDRFLFGAQTFPADTLRSHTEGLEEGDWVECGMSWLPDYISGYRGMNRVAQVVGIKDMSPSHRRLMLVDGGDALAPLPQPTVGVAAENATGGVALPITAAIVGTEVLAEFAISAAMPAHDSKLWTPFARVKAADVPVTVNTPPMPAGASVWVGARSVYPNRRPSLRTAAQQVVISNTPRVTQLRVEVSEETNAVTVYWVANAAALGLRLYYIAQASELSADPVAFIDVNAALGSYTIPGFLAYEGERVDIDFEPWSGWTGAAVAGVASDKVRATGGLGFGPVFVTFAVTNPQPGVVRVAATFSDSVVRWRVWRGYGLLVGITDLEEYSLGSDLTPEQPYVEFASIAGTYTIAARCYDREGRSRTEGEFHEATGETATGIGTPVLEPWPDGTPGVGYESIYGHWVLTGVAALGLTVERYVNGVMVGSDIFPAGDDDFGNTVGEEWQVPWGDRASLRVGLIGYPMSEYANLDIAPNLAPETAALDSSPAPNIHLSLSHPVDVPDWADTVIPGTQPIEVEWTINGVPSMIRRYQHPGGAVLVETYGSLGVVSGDSLQARARYRGGTYDVGGVWGDPSNVEILL
jgi:hypothetical protein